MLLDIGVDVSFSLPHGQMCHLERYTAFNALQFAVQGGSQNLINILTSYGATTFSGCPEIDARFLFDAITRDTIDFAKPLLARAATSNIKIFHKGIELFILAVESSYDKIIDLLLDAGFSPYSGSGQLQIFTWGMQHESAFMVALNDRQTRYLERFLKVSYHDLDKEQCQERLRQLTTGYVFAHRSNHVALKNAILNVAWRSDDFKLVIGYEFEKVSL